MTDTDMMDSLQDMSTLIIEEMVVGENDVEEIFGISKRYLEIAAQRNDGPCMIKIGRSVRYRVGDIRQWIEQCAVAATAGQGAGS